MHTQRHWLVRPGAFMLCLLCGVGVAIVLIEGFGQQRHHGSSQDAVVSASLAERLRTPFPRALRDSSGTTIIVPRPPQRIVSHTLGTDEILLALCAPQRLVALSILADDAQISNAAVAAQQVPGRASAGAEQTLRFQPDMVFVANYSKAELVHLLQAAHAPGFRLAHFDTLEDIKMNIRTLGYILGEDRNAEALVQDMERDLASVRARIPSDRPPLRVMLYGQTGTTAGARTTFDDMVRAVGAINVAATHGVTGVRNISREQLLQWNPEVLISSTAGQAPQDVRQSRLQDPAVAVTIAGTQQRIIVLPRRLLSTVTHHITEGIALLAHALYGPAS